MSLKPDHKMEYDEIRFLGEMGWFATLSVVLATFAPYLVDVFG